MICPINNYSLSLSLSLSLRILQRNSNIFLFLHVYVSIISLGANVMKLPNISASIPQLEEAIRELQGQGYISSPTPSISLPLNLPSPTLLFPLYILLLPSLSPSALLLLQSLIIRTRTVTMSPTIPATPRMMRRRLCRSASLRCRLPPFPLLFQPLLLPLLPPLLPHPCVPLPPLPPPLPPPHLPLPLLLSLLLPLPSIPPYHSSYPFSFPSFSPFLPLLLPPLLHVSYSSLFLSPTHSLLPHTLSFKLSLLLPPFQSLLSIFPILYHMTDFDLCVHIYMYINICMCRCRCWDQQ